MDIHDDNGVAPWRFEHSSRYHYSKFLHASEPQRDDVLLQCFGCSVWLLSSKILSPPFQKEYGDIFFTISGMIWSPWYSFFNCFQQHGDMSQKKTAKSLMQHYGPKSDWVIIILTQCFNIASAFKLCILFAEYFYLQNTCWTPPGSKE